ncbi:MAG: ABC transporter substrate-binding protein, partial [Humidesulfovibrio sp.]|uniref:ABC transporter substrate-binding protein n=1 Tax=Humidesulfovibrio sp. TaxID=2910988 RepID=UPI0027336D17
MRIRLRARIFLLALLAVLSLVGCSQAEEKPEEFRIGLMAPLSSATRFTMHRVAQARVDELNAQGGVEVGGRKMLVRLYVEDSGDKVEQAMSAMGRLVQQQRVSAIIGPYFSREAIPVAAAMETMRVPMISPSATNPEVTRGRTFAFRVCQVDSVQGAVLARFAYEDRGLRRAALLYDEADAYSSGLAGYFSNAFAAQSAAKVHLEPYQAGTHDFMPHLARIVAAGAQVLFLPNFPIDLARQIQQARAAGFSGQFLGGESWDTDRGFHSLPEAQGAVYETDFATAAADPKLLAAAQALAAKSGSELDKNTALTLDALGLLLAAAKSV